jgi:thiamine-phosphate pyrophosphorylase
MGFERTEAMKHPFDLSLMLVTDRPLCRGRDLLGVVDQAVQGGVTAVQLREKHLATREFVQLGREMKKRLQPRKIPLFINDRLDVAQSVGADGIHVGQEDMHAGDVRSLIGTTMAVGLSVNSARDVIEANSLDVDYLGAGPVFPTATKDDAKEALGIEGLQDLVSLSRHPVVAIGSVKASNVARVIKTGVSGVAVVSAICAADSPSRSAAELIQAIRSVRETASS